MDFTNINPLSNTSLTLTLVAVSGPLFETTIVHLIISPKSGVELSTYFLT